MPSGRIIKTHKAQAPFICEHQQCRERLWPGQDVHTVEVEWPDKAYTWHRVGNCCRGEFDGGTKSDR
jgi:hypothetical protein